MEFEHSALDGALAEQYMPNLDSKDTLNQGSIFRLLH